MSEDDDLLKQLIARADFHAAEAIRYRAAVAALGGTAVSVTRRQTRRSNPDDPRTSTMAMIELALGRTDSPLSLGALTNAMTDGGWITTSEAPANTVRTALGRMVARGQVTKREDSRYELPGSTTDA